MEPCSLSSLNEETLCQASFKQTVDLYRLVFRVTRTLLIRNYFDLSFVMRYPSLITTVDWQIRRCDLCVCVELHGTHSPLHGTNLKEQLLVHIPGSRITCEAIEDCKPC